MMQRTVLVGVDGSPSSSGALRWAAEEAARQHRALHVVHAIGFGPLHHADAGGLVDDAVELARSWQPTVEVRGAVVTGSAPMALTTLSRDAGLVVVGGRGHGGFTGLLLGSVSAQLGAHAQCPVLVVHDGLRWAGPESALPSHQPVVVGTDGSAVAVQAIGHALEEAAGRGVPLVVVRAWTPPAGHHRQPVSDVDLAADKAAARRALAADVDGWRGKFPDVPVEQALRHGGAAAVLTEMSRDALLVVTGARGHGGFAGLRLGSVSQQVLHHAACPVLVVRTPDPDDGCDSF
jgi:nucleotide-binding universal stress UspA family protein